MAKKMKNEGICGSISNKEMERQEKVWQAERLVSEAYKETPQYRKAVSETVKAISAQKTVVKKIIGKANNGK